MGGGTLLSPFLEGNGRHFICSFFNCRDGKNWHRPGAKNAKF